MLRRCQPVAPVIGAILLLVGGGVATTTEALASSAHALVAHGESGTPGPDAVTAFGAAAAVPGTTLQGLAAPVVGMAATPDGLGYWLVAADGGVFSYGDAAFDGSTGGIHLNQPIVGMAATPTGHGYWLVASDGGVFAFGDAAFAGSMGGRPLNQPIVGMAATPTGHGYWLVASDGGVFAFGDAAFAGSMGGTPLNQPVVGMAASPDRPRLLAGGRRRRLFAFGDAPFDGSMGGTPLNQPIVGMAASPDGRGYWMAAADGGIFAFGDAPFEGSDGGTAKNAVAVGMAGRPGGYWIAYGTNPGAQMIPAIASYVAGRADNVTVAVEDLTTGQIYQFRPGVVENTASTLKVDILATLLTQAQAAGRSLTPEEQSLAVPMIEESLDSAADTLWTRLGPGAVGAFESEAGMTSDRAGHRWRVGNHDHDGTRPAGHDPDPGGAQPAAHRCVPGLRAQPHGERHPLPGLGRHGRRARGGHRGPQERVRRHRRVADQHHRLGQRCRSGLPDRRAHQRERVRAVRHRHGQRCVGAGLELAPALTGDRPGPCGPGFGSVGSDAVHGTGRRSPIRSVPIGWWWSDQTAGR